MLGFVIIVIIGLLVVNYFRSQDTGELLPNNVADIQETLGETHTVVAGDSLWTISEEYYGTGFEWNRIVEANGLENENDIEEGQVLTIPTIDNDTTETVELAEVTETPEIVATPEATVEPTTLAVVTPSPEAVVETTTEIEPEPVITQNSGSYTVVQGDNLWNIAVSVYGDGYRWSDIAEANDLVNPGVIHSGNILVLPS